MSFRNLLLQIFLLILFCWCMPNSLAAQTRDSVALMKELAALKEKPPSDTVILDMQVLATDSRSINNLHVETEVLFAIGSVYYRSRKYGQAVDTYSQALVVCRKSVPKDAYLETKILGNSGIAAGRTGLDKEGRAWLEEAVALRQQLIDPEDGKMVSLYLNLGNAYFAANDLPRAKEYYERGIRIRTGIYGENHPRMRPLYNNLAITYSNLGQYPEAKEYVNKVITSLTQAEEPDSEAASATFTTLANIHELEGDFAQAIHLHQQALNIRLQAFGDAHYLTADSYYSLAVSHKKAGLFQEALTLVRKASLILDALPAKNEVEYLECYLVEGGCLEALGELAEAEALFKTTIDKLIAIDDDSALNSLGNAYNSLGSFYISTEQLDLAKITMEKEYALFQNLFGEQNIWTGDASYHLGLIAHLQEDDQKARFYIERCFTQLGFDPKQTDLSHCQNLELVQEPLILLGEIAIANGQRAEGFQLLQRYQEINDWLRANYVETLSKDLLVKGELKTAEVILDAVFANGDILNPSELTIAISTIQRTKAAQLFDELLKNNVLTTILPPDWSAEERALQSSINYYRSLLLDLKNIGRGPADEELLNVNQQYLLAKEKHEQFLAKVADRFPNYHQARYQSRTIDVLNIHHNLLPSTAGLLEFFITSDYVYENLILPDTTILIRVPLDFDLPKSIDDCLEGISAYYTTDNASDLLQEQSLDQYIDKAALLYDKLLKPLQAYLPTMLVIAPDADLNRLPFSILLKQNPTDINEFANYPYLLHDHQISYVYSIASWEQMSRANSSVFTQDSVLIVAPFSDNESARQNPLVSNYILPYTEREVDFLKTSFATKDLMSEEANQISVLQLIEKYPIVHFITHAKSLLTNNDYSALSLFPLPAKEAPSALYLKDVYNLRLNSELVVLSACETGEGSLLRGEGVMSLGRAFAYAGAKNIVNSLWEINDYSTGNVMNLFYQELARSDTGKATALHRAKKMHLKNVESVRLAHPYFWSGIVSYGDLSSIK